MLASAHPNCLRNSVMLQDSGASQGDSDLEAQMGPDHDARHIAQLVERLDLRSLIKTYVPSGTKPHRPDLMLKLVLYETLRGRHSPAQWLLDVGENQPLIWLVQGIRPKRTSLYDFRKRIAPLIEGFGQQMLSWCPAGLRLDRLCIALDGTFLASRASRHRLVKRRALNRQIHRLIQAIRFDRCWQSLLEQMPPNALVCALWVVILFTARRTYRGSWMATTAQGRQKQLSQRWQGRRRLRARMDQQAHSHKASPDPDQVSVSLSDPQAVLGRDKQKVFRPLYNVQVAVDRSSDLVVGYGVFAQAADMGLLVPMLDQVEQFCGHKPRQVICDSGYVSADQARQCEQREVELLAPVAARPNTSGDGYFDKSEFRYDATNNCYHCPAGRVLPKKRVVKDRRAEGVVFSDQYQCDPTDCPLHHKCTRSSKGRTVRRLHGQDHLDRLEDRMQQPDSQQLYALRQQLIERFFGEMRQNRNLTRIHGYGKQNAQTQIGLAVLVYNGIKIIKQNKSSQRCPLPVNET